MISVNIMPQVMLTKKILPQMRARVEQNKNIKCAIMTTSSRNAIKP